MQPRRDEVRERIEYHLRRHVRISAIAQICEAVIRGQVMHIDSGSSPKIIAYKRGVLFVAGNEYVIVED